MIPLEEGGKNEVASASPKSVHIHLEQNQGVIYYGDFETVFVCSSDSHKVHLWKYLIITIKCHPTDIYHIYLALRLGFLFSRMI